jgi:SAM-dependent methyltransferase
MTARYRFGENWQKFASELRPDQIIEAEKSVARLLGGNELSGRSFLDVGCGSGLFSLAARKMGARVTSFDFDADSVSCAETLRDRYYPNDQLWRVERGSVLDPSYLDRLGQFDIVYSWGVLHHTGAMWSALNNAAQLVTPGGTLAIALYRRTPLCGAWQMEKRCYASAPRPVKGVIRGTYKAAFFIGLAAIGQNPLRYVRNYKSNRGMDWHRNVDDWLGGFPYESASAQTVKQELERLGFQLVRSFEYPAGVGLFGTGCDEFVCQRPDAGGNQMDAR